MELIIGRESSSPQSIGRRLQIESSSKKKYHLGEQDSVPQTVSRQHCKIVVNNDRSMVLFNLNPNNITFVNGNQVQEKAIDMTDSIELGSDHYNLDL